METWEYNLRNACLSLNLSIHLLNLRLLSFPLIKNNSVISLWLANAKVEQPEQIKNFWTFDAHLLQCFYENKRSIFPFIYPSNMNSYSFPWLSHTPNLNKLDYSKPINWHLQIHSNDTLLQIHYFHLFAYHFRHQNCTNYLQCVHRCVKPDGCGEACY